MLVSGKRTKKLVQAIQTAWELRLYGQLDTPKRGELYDKLQKQGYWWDGKTWSQSNAKTISAFVDAHGEPTNHVKLRVMAHPDRITEVMDIIEEALRDNGLPVSPTSDKSYPNRNGPGVRVYMEGSLD